MEENKKHAKACGIMNVGEGVLDSYKTRNRYLLNEPTIHGEYSGTRNMELIQ